MNSRDYSNPNAALPPWMRRGDHAAEALIWGLLFGGILTWGYAEPGIAREFAWLGCAALGAWSVVGWVAGRWASPNLRTARWALLLLAAPLAWGGAQLWPIPAPLAARLSPAWSELLDGYAAAGAPIPARVRLAINPAAALEAWNELAACLMFFSCALLLASRRSSAHRLLMAVGLLSVLEGWLGFTSYVSGAGRSLGGVFNPNHHAALVAIGLPVYFARMSLWKRHTRYGREEREEGATSPILFLHGCGCVAVVGWLASFSRGGIIISGAVLLAWFAFEIAMRRRQSKSEEESPGLTARSAAIGAAGLALLVAAMIGLTLAGGFLGGLAQRGFEKELGGKGRIELWRATLEGLGQSPWTGLGFNGVKGMLTRNARLPLVTTPIWSHNDWLQWLAELGLPAALLCAAIAARLAWMMSGDWRFRAANFRWSKGLMQRAALAGVVASLAHALVDFHLRIPQIAFAFLALLALAISGGPILISSRAYGRLLGVPFREPKPRAAEAAEDESEEALETGPPERRAG